MRSFAEAFKLDLTNNGDKLVTVHKVFVYITYLYETIKQSNIYQLCSLVCSDRQSAELCTLKYAESESIDVDMQNYFNNKKKTRKLTKCNVLVLVRMSNFGCTSGKFQYQFTVERNIIIQHKY